MVAFDPAVDVPDQSGKTILVTGGTNGLGKETLFLLGPHAPAKIIFTGRNIAASEEIITNFATKFPRVPVSFIRCDQTSLASVQACARSVLASCERLDLLFAVAGVSGLPPAVTSDGYELQFGTNHIAHALLIKLLLPLLQRTAADPRIVIYSSDASRTMLPAGGIEFATLRSPQANIGLVGHWQRYAQSKLANALYARALAKRYPDVLAVSIHPGVAMTHMVNSLGWADRLLVYVSTFRQRQSPREVAFNGLWAATAPRGKGRPADALGKVVSGTYYRPIGALDTKIGLTEDDDLADKLWDWTEKELQPWMTLD